MSESDGAYVTPGRRIRVGREVVGSEGVMPWDIFPTMGNSTQRSGRWDMSKTAQFPAFLDDKFLFAFGTVVAYRA